MESMKTSGLGALGGPEVPRYNVDVLVNWASFDPNGILNFYGGSERRLSNFDPYFAATINGKASTRRNTRTYNARGFPQQAIFNETLRLHCDMHGGATGAMTGGGVGSGVGTGGGMGTAGTTGMGTSGVGSAGGGDILHLELWDDNILKDRCLGYAKLPLSSFLTQQQQPMMGGGATGMGTGVGGMQQQQPMMGGGATGMGTGIGGMQQQPMMGGGATGMGTGVGGMQQQQPMMGGGSSSNWRFERVPLYLDKTGVAYGTIQIAEVFVGVQVYPNPYGLTGAQAGTGVAAGSGVAAGGAMGQGVGQTYGSGYQQQSGVAQPQQQQQQQQQPFVGAGSSQGVSTQTAPIKATGTATAVNVPGQPGQVQSSSQVQSTGQGVQQQRL